jgi:hypothetical protein
MSTDFETVRPLTLFLGAAKGYRGVATLFEFNGHRATLIAPNTTSLLALCRGWGIEAPVADVAEPVVVLSRTIRTADNDGLEDGLDDGL